jgi:hypothetical protein
MRVLIQLNDKGTPPGKLADAEMYFDSADGPLQGLKLCGFAVWQRRDGRSQNGTAPLSTRYNVTFPARAYSVNGERRSFALLRPAGSDPNAQDAVRAAVLDAYARASAPAPLSTTPRTAADAADLLYPTLRASSARQRDLDLL